MRTQERQVAYPALPAGWPRRKVAASSRQRSTWLNEALKTHRVVLLDQRGTGWITRIESATMADFANAIAAADYLSHVRADSIIADCEHLRKTVLRGRTMGDGLDRATAVSFWTLTMSRMSTGRIGGLLCRRWTGRGHRPRPMTFIAALYPRVAAKNPR